VGGARVIELVEGKANVIGCLFPTMLWAALLLIARPKREKNTFHASAVGDGWETGIVRWVCDMDFLLVMHLG